MPISLKAHRALLVIGIVGGLFLYYVGAFGTGDAGAYRGLAFWEVVMIGAALIGIGVTQAVDRFIPAQPIRPLRIVLITLLWSPPQTLVVLLAYRWILGKDWGWSALPQILPGSLVVCGLIAIIDAALAPKIAATVPPPEKGPEERFMARLPLRFRHADLYALEAEDHYLRVHTSQGSDLILMRLSDAVAELEEADGFQTHRSWWVARRAAIDVRQEGRRAVLVLKDGSEAPVSRAQIASLKAQGWW